MRRDEQKRPPSFELKQEHGEQRICDLCSGRVRPRRKLHFVAWKLTQTLEKGETAFPSCFFFLSWEERPVSGLASSAAVLLTAEV